VTPPPTSVSTPVAMSFPGQALRRLVLAPVWLLQGLAVRRRVARLPEATGPRSGSTGSGPVLRLLILGDSSAAGVGVAHQDDALAGRLCAELKRDFTVQWQLHAQIGATTASTLQTLRQIDAVPFDAAVVVLGVNDVARQVPLKRWLTQQQALAELLRARFGLRRIYLSGVPPMGEFPALPEPLRGMLGARAAAFDTALAGTVRGQRHLRHLPFEADTLDPSMMADDGFHPGPAIYRQWAARLAAAIRADFASASAASPAAQSPPALGA